MKCLPEVTPICRIACRSAASALLFVLLALPALAQPRIDRIDPSKGPIAGGTAVTVSGSGLSGASLTVDGNAILPSMVADVEVRFTTPKHDNGYALVKISTTAGNAYAEFLYIPPKLEELPPGYITTVAGVGEYYRFHLPANTANVRALGIAVDAAQNIYFAWPNVSRVFKVGADGILEPFAGSGFPAGNPPNGDGGPATEARITFCRNVALDAAGNAYIPDESHRVRRVDATTGIITTIAGTGEAGYSGDGGPATLARLDHPSLVAAAPDATVYIMDFGNARIRRVSPEGIITTIAGTGVSGHSGDGGAATDAQLEMPVNDYDMDSLALDPRGVLYLAETYGRKIRRIDLQTGIITTFFGGSPSAPLETPRAVAVGPSGSVYVGSRGHITELDPAGLVLRRWGTFGFSEDGTSLASLRVGIPAGLAIESNGNILFSDVTVARLRRMNLQTGKVETVAGIAPRTPGIPGPAIGAVIKGDFGGLTFLPSGDLLFGDTEAVRIYRIDRAGEMTIFGGAGTYVGSPPDGVPISEAILTPVDLVADAEGGLYATDSGMIVYVDPEGITHRVTGGYGVGGTGYAGDGGPADKALVTQPWDVDLDREGNLFIADTNNNRIRLIDAKTKIITTVAGGGPLSGYEGYGHGAYCGDGGPALDACFNTPYSVAVDPDGNIFVSDYGNRRLRKVDTSGIIQTFGDPEGYGRIIADDWGGLVVAQGNKIRRFLPDGTSWIVAGTGLRNYFSGDGGPATEADIEMREMSPIAVDRDGNLFFLHTRVFRIRAVRFGAVLAPPDPIVALSSGSEQTAPLGTAFATPLEVSVRASWGSPAPNVRVDFQAPGSGPSCIFANGSKSTSAVTDRSGKAKAICFASGGTGRFDVTATPLGSGRSVAMHLTNTAAPRHRALRR